MRRGVQSYFLLNKSFFNTVIFPQKMSLVIRTNAFSYTRVVETNLCIIFIQIF